MKAYYSLKVKSHNGFRLWKTTAIIESDESETEVKGSKVVRDSDDDTNDGVVVQEGGVG